MGFKELNLKRAYDSDVDDILNEFYIPALSAAVKYQRLAGFFSSTSLAVAARGLAGLISNSGKMQLVCSAKLSKKDVDAIIEAKLNPLEIIEKYAVQDLETAEKIRNEFVLNHVKALGWMIANGLLEIKLAILKDDNATRLLDFVEIEKAGIFHQKVGILTDNQGNVISFSGSDNESARGWIGNIEEFKVFYSWDNMTKDYVVADFAKFDKFWNGRANRVDIFEVPEAVTKKLVDLAPVDIEEVKAILRKTTPKRKQKEVKLWPHQIEAVKKWMANNKRCIFEMATGTGKTFAALACLKEMLKEKKRAVFVIACPYSHLISQWKEDVSELGMQLDSVTADSTNYRWKHELIDKVRDVNNGIRDCLLIYTTHATFCAKDFKNAILQIKSKTFIVGDEVHGMWSEKQKEGFVEKYDYRLGLSATPSRWFDPEGTSQLFSYFNINNNENMFSFPLEKAVTIINPSTGLTYLTPYNYFPYFVELTEDEMEEYVNVTKKISKAYFSSKKNDEKVKRFNLLCIRRQEIIKNAENKLRAFETILNDIKEIKHCLVYCSPNQIENIQDILINKNINQHKFTQQEGAKSEARYGNRAERDYLLSEFSKGKYEVLVAMKCLDEGIDVPQARIGIILASTGNPRQYIQRRGRILRRYPGKESADIYDVMVFPSFWKALPNEVRELEFKIISKEFVRYEEFARCADNSLDCLRILHEKQKNIFEK